MTRAFSPGPCGAVICPIASGARCGRTTPPMAMPGAPSPTTRLARGCIAGAKTVYWVSATKSAGCVSPWRCGMASIRSSRRDHLAWATPRATTVKISRITTSTSPTPPPTASCGGSTSIPRPNSPTSSWWMKTVAAAAASPNTSWWIRASLMPVATSTLSLSTPRPQLPIC